MPTIRATTEFEEWFSILRDERAKSRVLVRIRRLMSGNAGDWAAVGEGVAEMRINYGPGYRVYFKQHGAAVVLLLAGGDKRTQRQDIALALRLARLHLE